MPGPGLDLFTTQPEPQPTAPQPVQQGGFGGASAQGLTEVGQQLFNVGWEAYQKAVDADAQDKENIYQTKALDLLQEYKSKFNGLGAVQAHSEYTQKLQELREGIAGSISSKHGTALFDTNTQRIQRLVQEQVDGHFEQQNRQYQTMVRKDAMAVDTRMLSTLAAAPKFDSDAAQAVADKIYKRDKQAMLDSGATEETADEHAKAALSTAMDGYFDVLTNKKNNRSAADVKAEYDKWNAKGVLDKHVQEKYLAATYAGEARSAVQQIFTTTPRLVNDPKFDGSPDPDGEPDLAAMEKQKNDYIEQHPEQAAAVEHEYQLAARQADAAFTQKIKSSVDRVVALARDEAQRNGQFHVDPTSRDYLWLLRNKSTALDPVIRSEYTTDNRLNKEVHEKNAVQLKADLISMSASDPDKFAKLTDADVFKMMGDSKRYGGGFNSEFQLKQSATVLKQLQDQHTKGELKFVDTEVQKFLAAHIYTAKDEAVYVKGSALHDALTPQLQEALRTGAVKRDNWKSIDDFLKQQTTKVDQARTFMGIHYNGSEFKALVDEASRKPAQLNVAQPAQAKAAPTVPQGSNIVTIKRNGVERQWDVDAKKWVK